MGGPELKNASKRLVNFCFLCQLILEIRSMVFLPVADSEYRKKVKKMYDIKL